MEGEESFDSSLLGYADEVVEERVADDDVIMIKGTKTTSAVGDFFFNFDYSFLDFTRLNSATQMLETLVDSYFMRSHLLMFFIFFINFLSLGFLDPQRCE